MEIPLTYPALETRWGFGVGNINFLNLFIMKNAELKSKLNEVGLNELFFLELRRKTGKGYTSDVKVKTTLESYLINRREFGESDTPIEISLKEYKKLYREFAKLHDYYFEFTSGISRETAWMNDVDGIKGWKEFNSRYEKTGTFCNEKITVLK